ncbi:MAG: aminopeptidase [Clostridiales bacterium]|nr:MAG: aminopeptidase [Clostridiales bacterium]
MQKGRLNKITDVKGVKVGHCTIDEGRVHTGVTVIMPSDENVFLNKLESASYVINGFGKTAGLVQIDELGQLESPIALTNTLCVGRVHDALVSYMIERCRKDGHDLKSINVVVGECNDGTLNDISSQSVEKKHVFEAIENLREDFEVGDVGAGRGMTCHGLKGGIGSSSRIVNIGKEIYTLGALVLANHGLLHQLTIDGDPVGKRLCEKKESVINNEKGSIMVIIATDAPLDSRQLKRICKRATAGVARIGSEFGNGSGDIVIGFSTANKTKETNEDSEVNIKRIKETLIDELFTACVESVSESIISALKNAKTLGKSISLAEALETLNKE